MIITDIDSPKVSKDFPSTKQYPKNCIIIVSHDAPNHNNNMQLNNTLFIHFDLLRTTRYIRTK